MTTLLNEFAPITLEQMSSVKLMNRTDTKFVTNIHKLFQLLEMACQDYYVQEIDGGRNLEYDTTYFDTTQYDMYNQHQWNHTNRQKIRFRTYCVNGLQFMEVKTKNNHVTERLTIDQQLRFHNLVSGTDRDMGDLVIIELKRDGLVYSPILEMLRKLRIQPHGFSKYCMGSALTNNELRVNRFKRKLIEVNKLVGTI